MIDHAFLFTEVVYSYLPKSCIPIYRNRVFLFANYDVLLFTDYNPVYKIHFTRKLWNDIDLVIAILLLIWVIFDASKNIKK
jgi:hypothetical protein